MSIGNALAEGRRQAGLTIADVSRRTCIRETIIGDIERGDFSGCGGDFYARGHVRSIARAVGMDPEPLIREYDATEGEPQAVTAAELFEPATGIRLREARRPNWTVALALALVLVFAVGIFAFRQFGAKSPAPVPSGQGSAAAAGKHPLNPTASASASRPLNRLDITLTATRDCWVGVKTGTGQEIFNGTVTAGQTKRWHVWNQVYVSLGNPSGVKLLVNKKNPVPPGSISPMTLSLAINHVPSY